MKKPLSLLFKSESKSSLSSLFSLLHSPSLTLPLLTSLHSHLLKTSPPTPSTLTALAHSYATLHLPSALQLAHLHPHLPTLSNILITHHSKIRNLEAARKVFDEMIHRTVVSWNALLDGYMKDGQVGKALEVFERIPERNVVSWTTVVNGLSRNGRDEEAIGMFWRMMREGGRPNERTVVSVLVACARIGALEVGVWVEWYVGREGWRVGEAVGAALVDMYAKCGRIEEAKQVFEGVGERGLRVWSAMVSGYAMHGRWEEAIQCFERMVEAGVKPDDVVFLSVLMAHSHSGMVEKGFELFREMKPKFGVPPDVKHYTCMVDLLGRAGRLEEACHFIEAMPVKPDFVTWGALFCACTTHKNVEMAKFASKKLRELRPKHDGSYVFLSNMYAGIGKWKEAERVRKNMKSENVVKLPAWSSVEVDGKIHNFLVDDRSHASSDEMYRRLGELDTLSKEDSQEPETDQFFQTLRGKLTRVVDSKKEEANGI